MNTRHQFLAMERFRQIVIRAKSKALEFAFRIVCARQNKNRRLNACTADLAQYFVTGHIRQAKVQKDQVIVIELGQIDAFFAKMCAIDIQVGVAQHHFDAFGRGRIIFN